MDLAILLEMLMKLELKWSKKDLHVLKQSRYHVVKQSKVHTNSSSQFVNEIPRANSTKKIQWTYFPTPKSLFFTPPSIDKAIAPKKTFKIPVEN